MKMRKEKKELENCGMESYGLCLCTRPVPWKTNFPHLDKGNIL